MSKDFIEICDDVHISEKIFKKNVIKYFNTLKNKSGVINLIIEKIAHRYSLIKIFFDYICKYFNINKKEIEEKLSIDKYLISLSATSLSISSLKSKFNLSLYFYDIDVATNVLSGNEYEYYHVLKNNPIDETDHRKILRKIKFARSYLENSLHDKNFEEVEKCLKCGYRPCKKTLEKIYYCSHFSADNTIIFIDLLIKYHISPTKIGSAIFKVALLKLSIELLDVCVKYGFNITHSGNEFYEPVEDDEKNRETDFVQKLINIGVDTFEIVDMIKDRGIYFAGR